MVLALLLAMAVQEAPARPAGNPGTWFSDADYPAAALAAEEFGTLAFTLTIDREGRPVACNVDESSGSATLDKTSCDLILARASFTAAKDKKGHTIDGRFKSRITWKLPEVETEPMTAWKSTRTIVVGSSAMIRKCDLVRPDTISLVRIFNCESMADKPVEPGLRRFTATASDAHPVVMVGELGAQFAEGPLGPIPAAPAGTVRQDLAAFEFDITEKGRIANCVQTEGIGGLQQDMCPSFTARFAPTTPPAAHKGRFFVAISVKAGAATY